MADAWQEVVAVKSENRRELSLIGPDISKRIEKAGLDHNIFQLVNLNLLDVSRTQLDRMPDGLGNLTNLTNLTLQNNALTYIPATVGNLVKLKFLDVSHNKLEKLPDEVSKLRDLQTLNASVNQLTDFPDVSTLASLHILNISHNKLAALPDGICSENLVHLSQINASNNQISSLPSELSCLPHLNSLHLANNQLVELPNELCECSKLKELILNGNKIKDRKLLKFTEQNSLKQVMAFLTAALEKESASGNKNKKLKMKKKKGTRNDEDVEDLARNIVSVLRFPPDGGVLVKAEDRVADVRPYVVCCVLRELNFRNSLNMFKRFIALQTRLHDTVCQKRQAATIATHDLSLVKGPLLYTAKPADSIMITPLFKTKEVSAAKLLASLRQEADALRKEKKRSTVSGIHKYLDLLKDKTDFPCLLDADGQVISFPPITNSDRTKISKDTHSILVEVTSSVSLDVCKKVMDTLLKETLQMGVGARSDNSSTADSVDDNAEDQEDEAAGGDQSLKQSNQRLVIEQVKVVDGEGGLKVLYPSRTDLQDEGFDVVRNWNQDG